jgi:hypothetical protein
MKEEATLILVIDLILGHLASKWVVLNELSAQSCLSEAVFTIWIDKVAVVSALVSGWFGSLYRWRNNVYQLYNMI